MRRPKRARAPFAARACEVAKIESNLDPRVITGEGAPVHNCITATRYLSSSHFSEYLHTFSKIAARGFYSVIATFDFVLEWGYPCAVDVRAGRDGGKEGRRGQARGGRRQPADQGSAGPPSFRPPRKSTKSSSKAIAIIITRRNARFPQNVFSRSSCVFLIICKRKVVFF